ncbi:DUF4760 domain-containing protein [Streptomyces vastus]
MDWIAFASMLVAVVAVMYSVAISRSQRKQERRNLFLSLNEQLMHPDLQRGRTLLRDLINDTQDAKDLFDRRQAEYWDISQAVAMFDLLGLYVKRDYVDEDLVMAEWGKTLTLVYEKHGESFIEAREISLGWPPYPHFKTLAENARAKGKGH